MLDRKGRKASWPTLSSQRVIQSAMSLALIYWAPSSQSLKQIKEDIFFHAVCQKKGGSYPNWENQQCNQDFCFWSPWYYLMVSWKQLLLGDHLKYEKGARVVFSRGSPGFPGASWYTLHVSLSWLWKDHLICKDGSNKRFFPGSIIKEGKGKECLKWMCR